MDAALKEERLRELRGITETVKAIHASLGADIAPDLLDEPIRKLASVEDDDLFAEFYARNLHMLIEMMQSAETVANYIRRQNDQVVETIDAHEEKKELE